MKVFRSIGSLFLALLVLVASSNFFVGVHACQGKVKAIAFLQDADGCDHSTLPPCHRAMMKNCCDDQHIEHAAQDLKKDVASHAGPTPLSTDVIHTPVVLAELIPSLSISSTHATVYHPPLLAANITLLHEVFLI